METALESSRESSPREPKTGSQAHAHVFTAQDDSPEVESPKCLAFDKQNVSVRGAVGQPRRGMESSCLLGPGWASNTGHDHRVMSAVAQEGAARGRASLSLPLVWGHFWVQSSLAWSFCIAGWNLHPALHTDGAGLSHTHRHSIQGPGPFKKAACPALLLGWKPRVTHHLGHLPQFVIQGSLRI